jgi:23S rRNA (uracil1939-C5)-methyltransferase
MARRTTQRIVLENITVTDLAAEGKAIAKIDDMVIFFEGAIPGDVVDLLILRKKRNYAEAKLLRRVEEASDAQNPFCRHFGVCGGCCNQRLPYEKQLEYKRVQVREQLRRIGGFDEPDVKPVKPANKTEFYRNKLEFTFSNKRWLTDEEISEKEALDSNGLGFHVPGRFDKVINIEECSLQAEPSNSIRLAVRMFALQNRYEFFDIRSKSGFLRTLIIRTSSTGQTMAIQVFFYEDEPRRRALLDMLRLAFPEISSLYYVINNKGNDSIADLNPVCYHGMSYIEEKMDGLVFRIGPKSFYQTNSEQARTLYGLVREYAHLTGSEIVYDLYTGTGTIANFIASKAKKVVGVEYVPEAVADAKINSEINGISNTVFYAGDMKDILTDEFVAANGRPDTVILDPPRAGLHPSVIKALLEASPNRIVYVSCNPATQARDMAMLAPKYRLIESTPVDMFPHTHHIENVALLMIT